LKKRVDDEAVAAGQGFEPSDRWATAAARTIIIVIIIIIVTVEVVKYTEHCDVRAVPCRSSSG
jgi:ABC-type sugar transport system permease subunit